MNSALAAQTKTTGSALRWQCLCAAKPGVDTKRVFAKSGKAGSVKLLGFFPYSVSQCYTSTHTHTKNNNKKTLSIFSHPPKHQKTSVNFDFGRLAGVG